MLFLADVIFPAFSAPYFAPIFFPVAGIAAIGTEWLCYRLLSKQMNRPTLWDVIFVNLVSWLVGIILSFFLPSGLISKPIRGGHSVAVQGPHFTAYAIIAFPVACILSIVIEFEALRRRKRDWAAVDLFRLSAIANTSGYVVLFFLVWIWIKYLPW